MNTLANEWMNECRDLPSGMDVIMLQWWGSAGVWALSCFEWQASITRWAKKKMSQAEGEEGVGRLE